MKHYHVPPAFVHSLCRHYLPSGRGLRKSVSSKDSRVCDYWYFLPVRVQVKCTDNRIGHVSSTASNLHLPDAEVDIRGSSIAIYSSYDTKSENATFMVFSLMDGRWAKVVEEPRVRIEDTIKHFTKIGQARTEQFPHLIYLSSASRWWTNALSSVNEQLISYVRSHECCFGIHELY
jgi:hypothetical protein